MARLEALPSTTGTPTRTPTPTTPLERFTLLHVPPRPRSSTSHSVWLPDLARRRRDPLEPAMGKGARTGCERSSLKYAEGATSTRRASVGYGMSAVFPLHTPSPMHWLAPMSPEFPSQAETPTPAWFPMSPVFPRQPTAPTHAPF